MSDIYIRSSYPYGFKIRSHATLQEALDKHIAKGHEHILILHPGKALFLTIRKTGEVELSFKNGDLYDMWNATLGVPSDQVFKTLWNYRKQLNEHFFPND